MSLYYNEIWIAGKQKRLLWLWKWERILSSWMNGRAAIWPSALGWKLSVGIGSVMRGITSDKVRLLVGLYRAILTPGVMEGEES